ncbi:MAG: hypothetical protein ABIF77_22315 [bacterium]
MAVFLGAYLLFQVQLLLGKFLLPWFGGVPAVWITCLLFFQIVLLVGYGGSLFLGRVLAGRKQLIGFGLLLAAGLGCLPIVPGPGWQPLGHENPLWLIVRLLAVTVGLPFLTLACAGPLFQVWFARLYPGHSPYGLYAWSNSGSLLALLLFPFVLEPTLSNGQQVRFWTALFVVWVALVCGCLIWMWRGLSRAAAGAPPPLHRTRAVHNRGAGREIPTVGRPWEWLSWSAAGVFLFMAVTNRLCLDIASVPFLWVAPLGIYLLSFIVTFGKHAFYSRRFSTGALLAAVLGLFLVAPSQLKLGGGIRVDLSLTGQVVVHLASLAILCLVCQGELYRLRPGPERLTSFYFFLAAGGAVGGALVTLVAPLVFPLFQELYLGVLSVCGLMLWTRLRSPRGLGARFRSRRARLLLMVGAGLLMAGLWVQTGRLPDGAIFVERNFHGAVYVLHVDADAPDHNRLILRHGSTKHGAQYLKSRFRPLPTTYYSPFTGVGLCLEACQAAWGTRANLKVGVVGLGVGTLASYGQPGDTIRMYEINPLVVRVASEQLLPGNDEVRFTYLQSSPAECQVVLGDARLRMEQELQVAPQGQQFDILVLDAFNSDAIPTHLLTVEAFELYQRHLKAEGVIAVNISSNNFDLRPICFGLAAKYGFGASCITNRRRDVLDDPRYDCDLSLHSIWIVLYRSREFLSRFEAACEPLIESGEVRVEPAPQVAASDCRLWTDSYSNLWQVLVRGN